MKQITKLFSFAFFLLTTGLVLTSCANEDNPVVTPPDVTIFATNPPMVEDQKLFPVDTEHPENTPFNAKLHVPAGCKAAYAAAGGWKDFSQCKGIYEDAVTD